MTTATASPLGPASAPEPAPRRGDDTRARIERAALELFVAEGLAETSIKDIARAAGVSQGALYVHYPSKEALARALFERGFAFAAADLEAAAAAARDVPGQLAGMVRALYERFDADWPLFGFCFRVRHRHAGAVPGGPGNPYTVFRRVIAEAQAAGRIPPRDPDLMAALVTGAIMQPVDIRILTGAFAGPLADRAPEVAAACARLLA